MTRNECENLINEKLHEIVSIYHQYNPDGKYLGLFFAKSPDGNFYSFNNAYWPETLDEDGEIEQAAGEDVNFPIQYWKNEKEDPDDESTVEG